MYTIKRTPEYQNWFYSLSEKHALQIDSRLIKVKNFQHFGEYRFVGTDELDIYELKWTIGWRVYFAFLTHDTILLLLGGNKNGQDKDINQAKKILQKYFDENKNE